MARFERFTCALVLSLATLSCADSRPQVKPEPSTTLLASDSARVQPSAVPSQMPTPTALASARPIDPNAPLVVFTSHKDVVGTKYRGHAESHMKLEASAIIKTIRSLIDEESDFDSEVLAVANGTATKSRIVCTKFIHTRETDGVKKSIPGVVEGRAYLVERAGEKLNITGDDGKPLTPDEDDELRLLLGPFGRPDGVGRALALKPYHVGERLPEVEAATRERFELGRIDNQKPGDSSAMNDVKVTLLGTDSVDGQDLGVLDIFTKTSGVQGGGDMTLDSHATSRYRLDTAELLSSESESTSTFSKSMMKGSGTITMRFRSKRLSGPTK